MYVRVRFLNGVPLKPNGYWVTVSEYNIKSLDMKPKIRYSNDWKKLISDNGDWCNGNILDFESEADGFDSLIPSHF